MPVLASCNIYKCDTCGLGTISITRYYTSSKEWLYYTDCQKVEGAYDSVYRATIYAHEECNYCHVGYDYEFETKTVTECSH